MHEKFAGLIKAKLEQDHQNTASVVPLEMLKKVSHGKIPLEAAGEVTLDFTISDKLVKTKYHDENDLTFDAAQAQMESELTRFSAMNWAETWLEGSDGREITFQDTTVDFWNSCHHCQGSCREECPSCAGSKTQPCTNRCNNGRVKCKECDGHGAPLCNGCSGTGSKFVTTNYPVQKTEMITCGKCNGRKRSGFCWKCTGGTHNCYTCDGRGKITCKGCNGNGKISCRTCEGVGSAGYRRTAKPEVSCRVDHRAQSDQSIFGLMRAGTTSFLRSPPHDTQKTGLKVAPAGLKAEFSYSSAADYACTYDLDGDKFAAYVAIGNETSGVESGGGYLAHILEPTAKLLTERNYDALNTYPLGKSCLRVMADKSASDPLFGRYGGQRLLGEHIASARKDVMRYVTRGQWIYVAFIGVIALISGFLAFNPGIHYSIRFPKEPYIMAVLAGGAVLSGILLLMMESGQARRARRLIGDGYLPKKRMRRISVRTHLIAAVIGCFTPMFV